METPYEHEVVKAGMIPAVGCFLTPTTPPIIIRHPKIMMVTMTV